MASHNFKCSVLFWGEDERCEIFSSTIHAKNLPQAYSSFCKKLEKYVDISDTAIRRVFIERLSK